MKSDEKWSTYEANLQSYRNIFLSSQSIMLAVGAIIVGESYVVTLLLAIISIFQICYVWIPVIYYRSLLVDFHKYNLEEQFNCNGDILSSDKDIHLTERIYCKQPKIRKKVNKKISETIGVPFKNIRDTRRKIDITIPISISLIWLIYVLKSLVDSKII